MLGRPTASQIASASLASFFCDFTYGFTNCGAISRTQTAENARPVMRAATDLDADQTRRHLGEESDYLTPPQLPTQYPSARPVGPCT